MILKASQRGGAIQLADHISNARDNEHVELHDIRGFVSDTIHGALMESYAVSRGTCCKQHMFSLSLNPPPNEAVPTAYFEDALQRIEKKMGLEDQPRVVVFHEKEGRRHAHAVWSRIDIEEMKAVNLPYFKMKLNDISHDLYLEHGWDLPDGFKDNEKRNHNNYTLAEHQQSKRTGQSRKELKSLFQECWEISDTKIAFEHALQERGFLLAQGDRRSFVAVDGLGEVYSLSRMTGLKTRVLEERLDDPEQLPSVEERRAELIPQMQASLERHLEETKKRQHIKTKDLEKKREELAAQHRRERDELAGRQSEKLTMERRERQKQLARGLRGLWDRVSGKRERMIAEHKAEDEKTIRRDLKEREALIERQLEERRRLQLFIDRARDRHAPEMREALSHAFVEPKHESEITKRIRKDPEILLSLITERESVFTRSHIAKELSGYIHDPEDYHEALTRVLSSKELVALQSDTSKPKPTEYYSTREIVTLESDLLEAAITMSGNKSFGVPHKIIQSAIYRQDQELQTEANVNLSDEQRKAIEHITGGEQLSCVIGVAGAGKSTMLAAARMAWESAGHKVFGAAMAGKAAKGLEQSSGIKSKTLASYEISWENDLHGLEKGDVLVIDEAGMIGSKQMAKFITEVKNKGAKLVLVGDAEQLQPINAGAPFRTITEKTDIATLHNVHRQKQDWQRQASKAFAKGETQTALQVYDKHGAVQFSTTADDAIDALARDYMKDYMLNGNQTSRLALAHRRVDVRALNKAIRQMRKSDGELEEEITYKTAHGSRAFAEGDRLLFTRNDRDLGVKNGMLGTVTKTSQSHLTIALDGDDENSTKTSTVTVSMDSYDQIDHGYATTIHKSQGATIDKTFVLASNTMDRHLTYVAMTRHKNEVNLYAAHDEFQSHERFSKSLSRVRQKQSTLDFQQRIHTHTRDNLWEPVHSQ